MIVTPEPKVRTELVLFTAAATALIGLALVFVLHGVLNADEGFYLAASHLVSQGHRPYHDFGYTQGPLFPYANLVWLELFGYSLAGQRMAGLAWTVLTLAVGVVWLRRQHSWRTATVFVVLLLGAPVWLAFAVKGKTYAIAGLAVLIGARALMASWPMSIRWLVFVGAAACGTGARLPVAGFFAPAFVGLLLMTPNWRNRLLAMALTAISAAAILYAFGGENWERFVFWTTGFHRDSSFYIPVWTHFVDAFRFTPVLWVFAVVVALSLRARLGGRGNPGSKLDGSPRRPSALLGALSLSKGFAPRDDNVIAQLVVLVSLAVAFVSNLSASTTYAEYIFPFIPTLAFIVAPVGFRVFSRISGAWRVLVGAGAVVAGWNYLPEFSRDLLLHAGQAEAVLHEIVPPGAQVACSMPEVAIAVGARIPLTMAMGKFSITEDFTSDMAHELRMLTPNALHEILIDPNTKALVSSTSYNWNFFWSLPSYRQLSASAQADIRATIRAYYRFAFVNEEYLVYVRRETGDGR